MFFDLMQIGRHGLPLLLNLLERLSNQLGHLQELHHPLGRRRGSEELPGIVPEDLDPRLHLSRVLGGIVANAQAFAHQHG